jgi:4,5-DOPA dioxygenase extradiol
LKLQLQETAMPMPVLYLSHGAPPLADDALWTQQLADWSAGLPKPSSILMVSAHWENAPLTVGATTTVPLVYDFWGFPKHYYEVTYAAPGAPELAAAVGKLAGSVHEDPGRGLDHGAYVPLKEMYPDADVPVLQMSMPSLDPEELFSIGQKLAPLRDEGVLIVGSGFFTHNLSGMQPDADGAAPTWSQEFDHWGEEALAARDFDALLDFRHRSPSARLAHPRTEHFAPLFVAMGAALAGTDAPAQVIDGYWHGLAKRSVQFS